MLNFDFQRLKQPNELRYLSAVFKVVKQAKTYMRKTISTSLIQLFHTLHSEKNLHLFAKLTQNLLQQISTQLVYRYSNKRILLTTAM